MPLLSKTALTLKNSRVYMIVRYFKRNEKNQKTPFNLVSYTFPVFYINRRLTFQKGIKRLS